MHSSTPKNHPSNGSRHNSSMRPPSTIWSQLSKPTISTAEKTIPHSSGLDQHPKSKRTSFIHTPSSSILEDTYMFSSKGRKPWSWSRTKRLYRRQSRLTRLAFVISSGLLCLYFISLLLGHGATHVRLRHHQYTRAQSRRERARKVKCDPNISQSLPLSPKVLSNGTHDFDPTVIVLSYDGMRADYLERGLTPNMISVGNKGVVAEYMKPSFPTLTFPNHHSMSTGLYPSSHGIVANMFYDPHLDDDFNYKIPDKSWGPKWWGGEPIWETAVLQNQRSGVIMWPGGESLRPVRPTYHERFRSTTSVSEKMSTLLGWLDKPREERPTVMTVYIGEVDSAGHDFGPDSRRCAKALGEVDSALGELLEGLRERNLEQVVNLLLVSDHGMSYVTPQKCIYYDDYIDTSDLLLEESLQPHLGIRTKDPKRQDEMYHTLKSVQQKHNLPFKVYTREEMPARYNYAANDRIAPVIVLADPGHVMTRRDMGLSVVGVHGWDNESKDMRAIFMASGPSFPSQGPTKLQPFENVELHEIIARTVGLKVKPGSTDGVLNGYVSRTC